MKNQTIPQLSTFPVGDKNPPENSQYFIGQSYLAPLANNSKLNSPVYNVTFEPACRNNWHSHTGGQILIAVGGRGYYQEKGMPTRVLMPGDVVEIAHYVVHWHGAAPDSWFSHLAISPNAKDNKTNWLDPVNDNQYREAITKNVTLSGKSADNYATWFPGYISTLSSTDPELAEIFGNFAFGETQQYSDMNNKTRIMVTMASTIAQNTIGEYKKKLYAAYANGVTPIEIKEILYHATPYVGMARITDLLSIANNFLTANGVSLPLASQAVVTMETRQEKGLALQKSIFGKQIDKLYESSPATQLHLQKFLSANCFGDYQTRPALDIKTRELLTYAILISFGGCESQVKGHIQGNLNVGNDKAKLLSVTTQLLPYIGYPRTLNAIACLNEIIPNNE